MKPKVALIRGDGVGPELSEAALLVLRAVGEPVEVLEAPAGYEWWQEHGGPSLIPESSWQVLREARACLKAPTTTPLGPGTPKSVAVSIRQAFNLYANVRPIRTYEGTPAPLGAVNFICVREATEELYSGLDFRLSPDAAITIRKITRQASEKVCEYAFSLAKGRGWSRVVVVNKANILKESDGLFLEVARSVAARHPGIALEEYLVDNLAQQLVKNPQRFNESVLLGPNLFMDIISEEASALVASIGMIPSANIGDNYAMFEPSHGSAPKYKGQNRVNPVAMILSAGWLLEYLGFTREARAIEAAVEEVLREGKQVTYDLGGSAGTKEMAEAIAVRASSLLSAPARPR
ncbi:MAG: 3-isopropylmalate dehydrogenase [Nitrososphaerota archaeon]